MLSIYLLCRTLHRHTSRITLHQAAADFFVPELIRPQFYIPSHNISTSFSAHARIDEEIYSKSFKQNSKDKPWIRTSVFTAGTAKRRSPEFQSIKQNVRAVKNNVTLPTEPLRSDDWSQLKEKFDGKGNYETLVFQVMIENNTDFKIAKSLLSFIGEKDGDISYQILMRYLVLCVRQNQVAEIFDLYDIMKRKFNSFDTGVSSLFIRGLGKTDRWRQSIALLETMKKVSPVSSRNYADCVMAAIEHQESTLAFTLYDEMVENNKHIDTQNNTFPEDMVQSLFDFPQNLQDDDYRTRLISILRFFRENQLYPGDALMKSIKSWFESIPNESWKGKLTKISKDGSCQSCKEQIESIHLTPEEYSILKKAIIDNIIKGEDVFRKTNPQELKSFITFVDSRPPYDVVVDGLNMAYTFRNRIYSDNLLNLVLGLRSGGKRVLVLGRKHMLISSSKWQKQDMQRLQANADCFFLDNISKDDPFLIYACMNSGNHCCFLTQDLLRDHKACLPDAETQLLFLKWQRGHQLALSTITPGNFHLLPVLSYDTILQSTDISYHIPYDRTGVVRANYEVPKTWLCLRKEQ